MQLWSEIPGRGQTTIYGGYGVSISAYDDILPLLAAGALRIALPRE